MTVRDWLRLLSLAPFAAIAIDFVFLLLPCRLKLRTIVLAVAVLVACALKTMGYAALGGHLRSPDLPWGLVVIWDIANVGLVFSAPLAFVTGLVGLFFPLRARRMLAFLVVLVAWGVAAVGVWSAQVEPRIHEVEMRCEGLPSAMDGYRIVQLADIHVCAATAEDRIARTVERVNALKPDLVALTGDYADGYAERRWRLLSPLKNLRASDGVVAVTGNHEYYFGFYPLREKFHEWGVRLLENDGTEIAGGVGFVGGVNDPIGTAIHPEFGEKPDVAKAFAKAKPGCFRILLSHEPKMFPVNVARHDVRLQLSGHTHGGMMPVVYDFARKTNGGFIRGIYESAQGRLYVSPGMGEWYMFPVRFFDPTEITFITLRK